MKFKIKKKLFEWQIINEEGTLIATIQNKKALGVAKVIKNEKEDIIFTTNKVHKKEVKEDWNRAETMEYVICEKEEIFATATFHYAKNPNRMRWHTITLRPPQIDQMQVDTPYGYLMIERQKDNSILIKEGDKVVGKVTSFFSFKPQEIEWKENYEPTLLAGLYVLIDYMMHEDDLIKI